MALDVALYLSIALLPVWIIGVHAACQRIFEVAKPDLGVQAGAVFTALLIDCSYAGGLFGLRGALWPEGAPADVFAGTLYVFLSVNAMAFFYFQFVNVALTSIHMGVLLRIHWANGLTEEALAVQYDQPHMIGERLRRLGQLGQVEVVNDELRLRSHLLIVLSTPIYLWRRLLRVERH